MVHDSILGEFLPPPTREHIHSLAPPPLPHLHILPPLTHMFLSWKSCQRHISSCTGNRSMKFVSNTQIILFACMGFEPTTLGLGNSRRQTQLSATLPHELSRHPSKKGSSMLSYEAITDFGSPPAVMVSRYLALATHTFFHTNKQTHAQS